MDPTPQLAAAPPVARREPRVLERFGLAWSDDWAWLRDPGYPKVADPEILAYLEAENAHFRAFMAPHEPLIERLHAELKGRLKEDDASVPVRDGAFEYHWAYAPGAQYRGWWRRAADAAPPTLLLDENAMAAGRAYFSMRGFAPSPDGRRLAFATDEDGSERYRLRVRDLETGAEVGSGIANTSGAAAWAEDGGRTLLYVELNEQLRPWRVRAHRVGDDPATDPVLYAEADPAFFVSLGRTRDRAWLVIGSGTHVTREVRVLPADRPEPGTARLVSPRREGHRYSLDSAHGRFWIVTNDRHENFRLASAPSDDPGEGRWEEVLPGSADRYLLGVSCFRDFMTITERTGGLSRVRVRGYGGEAEHAVAFGEEVYTATLGDNRTFDADRIRLLFSSMITPATVFDYVVPARELVTRKVQEIPSGYDRPRYRSRRLTAIAPDGAEVPVTLAWRDDAPRGAEGRLLLYGYGAYGMGLDPTFSPHRLSLLDRGFAFAIAHVRGGDELGWRWYEDGKLEKKENSFTDFVAAAERLIAEGVAEPGRIAIRGGSAGGLLVGAALNLRPELWRCAVLEVPFVDVVNTILDAGLPLTPIEWPEWGNPVEDEAALRRLLRYSPYDNIRPAAYPPAMVTAGLSDPRVTYWEPAKYVARLRATKTDANPLLLRTTMAAGHFGRSGRYDSLRDQAEALAFVLACFGLAGGEAA